MPHGCRYDVSYDWWGIGILIFEMLAGVAPFSPELDTDDDTLVQIVKFADGLNPVNFPSDFPPVAKHLVNRLICANPRERISPAEAKRHPLFEGVDFEALEKGELMPPYVPPVTSPTDTSQFDAFDEDSSADDDLLSVKGTGSGGEPPGKCAIM